MIAELELLLGHLEEAHRQVGFHHAAHGNSLGTLHRVPHTSEELRAIIALLLACYSDEDSLSRVHGKIVEELYSIERDKETPL